MNKKQLKLCLCLIITLILISCGTFLEQIENPGFEVINAKGKDLSIVFSHNINGETHPCGCRHFPLGGLPQVAGQLHEIKKTSNVIYVDTGDLLYPSSVIPTSLHKSLKHTADNLVKAMNMLELNYFVPGDQDFAVGFAKLQRIADSSKFKFLISNLANKKSIKHKRWVQINNGVSKIFLLGIVAPTTLGNKYRSYFTEPISALKATIKEIKKAGFDPNNTFHRLIVLSHSGIDLDETIAKGLPRIDWIIGAHSQSFTKDPIETGNTKIVQVLSRNHYMGQITFKFSKDRSTDTYKLLENRENFSKKLSPNPFIEFISAHKSKLSSIQEHEQLLSETDKSVSAFPMPTSSSCIECHQAQGNFWKKTPHSLAYATLIRAEEENNTQCIGCHSVGFKKGNGFFKPKGIIHFSKQENWNKKKIKKMHRIYKSSINAIMKNVISVRRLSENEIYSKSNQIIKLDDTFKIETNFSNVQCLNCHGQTIDHPFDINKQKTSSKRRFQNIQNKCLSCHTKDQSISWYKPTKKGLPGDLDQLLFFNQYKKMACPKIEQ